MYGEADIMKKICNLTLTKANPLIKDHMVYGQNLLPGLAYIDILYQVVKQMLKFNYDECCLRKLTIFNPLIVTENMYVKLRISVEKQENHWNIAINGSEVNENENTMQYKLYATAELYREAILLNGQINDEAIKQLSVENVNIETIYEECRRHELIHKGMIKARGKVYFTDSKSLIEVSVDDKYLNEAQNYIFHPTLIDGSAIASASILNRHNVSGDDALYIPLYYESFSATEPLQSHCYATMDFDSFNMVNDICQMNILFYNVDGKQVAKLDGITAKKVRYKDQINTKLINESSVKQIKEDIKQNNVMMQNPISNKEEYKDILDVENILRKIIKKYLPQCEIDLDAGFFEAGLQSSQLLFVVQDIEKAFSLSLSPVLLFENANLRQLIEYLKKEVALLHRDDKNIVNDESIKVQNANILTKKEQKSENANKSVFVRKKNNSRSGDIAVVGLSGRYPQSYNIKALWENLEKGKNCVTQIPTDRWNWKNYYSEDRTKLGYIYSKWGGFIDEYDRFDPRFFNISPIEAKTMDPQERLFIEHCWMALEDAGYTRSSLQAIPGSDSPGQVGVYVSVMLQEYLLYAVESSMRGRRVGLGGGTSTIANRVSYFCDFHGPSMAIDTACSGALTAMYLAYQALKDRSIDAALVGGVNLSIHPNKYLMLSQGQFISSRGYCGSFGEGTDGYVPAEGVGALFLKRLEDAERDGDHIYGVIKSIAINHGGRSSGYTVPSPKAQSIVISKALKEADINPETISYIEAHGTGTKLGDPIEIEGLTRAYRENGTKRNQYCFIGSIKSNIGHCEAAAGVSSITKVLLQMEHKKIVPSLHSKILNTNIDFARTPFKVNQELKEWKRPIVDGIEFPRRAGISGFGAGGANAHVIIEEYQENKEKPEVITNSENPAIIVLSARTKDQLRESAMELLDFILENEISDDDIPNMAYTLQVGREVMNERLGLIVNSVNDLKEKLKKFTEGCENVEHLYSSNNIEGIKEHKNIFAEDEELQEAIEKWIQRKKYDKFLIFWVKGFTFDWNKLYKNKKMHRVSLPTYPFSKERFWIYDREENLKNIESICKELPENEDGFQDSEILMLKPSWKEQSVEKSTYVQHYDRHIVFVCCFDNIFSKDINNAYESVECTILNFQGDIEEKFELYVTSVFEKIQSIIKEKRENKIVFQIVIPNKGSSRLLVGLTGIIKTTQYENPNFIGQLIEVDCIENAGQLINILKENSRISIDNHIVIKKNKRYVSENKEIEFCGKKYIPWKDKGVYIITGGMGGLGLIFAKEIACKVKDPVLILLGRSDFDKNKEIKINNLRKLSSRIEYIKADVTDREVVIKLLENITERYGTINGIIHSAGIIKDSLIVNKTKDEIVNVLAPKVRGAVNLDKASKNIKLDFYILFSSIAGVMGNIGQGDYSTANAFMDAYAKYRNELVMSGKRYGRTISINWPLWQDGGMHMDEQSMQVMKNKVGMTTIKTLSGIQALYSAMHSGESQVMVYAGELNKIRSVLLNENINVNTEEDKKLSENINENEKEDNNLNGVEAKILNQIDFKISGKDNNYTELEKKIAQIWCELLGVNKIDIDDNFFELGGNSMVSIKFEAEMEKIGLCVKYSDIKNHCTVKELAQYVKDNIAVNKESKKILNNIEPFNDIFYKNCFYNSFFPVVKHFNGNVMSYIVNDIIVYNYGKNNKLNVEYIPVKEIGQVMHDEGISMDAKEISENIVEDIKSALLNDRLVILWADCYYMSIRREMYHKNHLPHTWLIYGYDEKTREFMIIEHKNAENLAYDKLIVGFDELTNAYKGYLQNPKDGIYSSYMEVYGDGDCSAHMDDDAALRRCKQQFIHNILNNKNILHDSMDNLTRFSNEFAQVIVNENSLCEEAEQLMKTLNNIINSKKVEKFRCERMFESEHNLISLIEEMIEEWGELRGIVGKFLYSSKYNQKACERSLDTLKNVVMIEKNFLDRIIGLTTEADI